MEYSKIVKFFALNSIGVSGHPCISQLPEDMVNKRDIINTVIRGGAENKKQKWYKFPLM